MKKPALLLAVIAMAAINSFAQIGINDDGSSANPSAALDVKSTDKGFLPPRMNTLQRDAIGSPAVGLMIFNTDCNDIQSFNGSGWVPSGNTGMSETPGVISGNDAPCANAAGVTYSIVPATGADGYNWTIPTGAILTGGQGTTSITVTFGSSGGRVCVAAHNDCNRSMGSCLQVNLQTTVPPPVAGTHTPSQTEIVWNWNTVPGATGYKWNTTNDFGSATDMGTSLSKTETGLACNTAFSRYAWAYNACGHSTALAMSQSTTACTFTCGSTLTINHVSGAVAPVSKTVTYGTVTNIPGESTKCWITSNLGADHQATSKDDATEASAGWYWQYNRKQGYKHNGSTVTPAWTITSISENSDWLPANDPCAIELGGGWRIPTSNEWANADAAGGWTNWNGPWSIALKLHGAGYLYSNSSLLSRGSVGLYRSSTQNNNTFARFLYIDSGLSYDGADNKAYGITVRCVK